MKYFLLIIALIPFTTVLLNGQVLSVEDDFEGNGTISAWIADDSNINPNFDNPFQEGVNASNKVLEYNDVGGQYANVRFETPEKFDLKTNNVFTLKIYIPSNGLSGTQENKVSLKLQDGSIGEPWTSQSEIIKPLILNQWQIVRFDFENDNYINLDGNSLPPTQRNDFDRVVIQVNGENNNDFVLAYIDDFSYNGTIIEEPVFDNLVWSDEFDTDGPIDSDKWYHQTQLPEGGSWFNGEVQHYTNRLENSFVENGVLKLIAKKETFTDQGHTKAYTSARLNSKYAFTYGRVEVRAKLPTGAGTWPAIWMLGKNINEDGGYFDNQGFGTTGWPACGEIDIMEHWGDNQNYVSSATHTPSSFGNTFNHGGQSIPTVSTSFHNYALEWSPNKLTFSVDDIVHFTYNPEKNNETWPFDAEEYFLLNIAIQPNISQSFTSSAMEIDYIRVYQESPLSTSSIPENLSTEVYPVPFTNQLTVDLKNVTDQNTTLSIYSLDGALVKTYNGIIANNSFTLNNLDFLSNGLYILKFQADNKPYTVKVIKN